MLVDSLSPVTETAILKKTPLYDTHIAAGARLVPFAGWQMPVQYKGVKEEHLAVRKGVGIFDVSHMGQIETRGDGARDFLQAHLTNNLEKVPLWGAQYALMCREDGGVIDDLITYRLPADGGECFLTVVNASNIDNDFGWLSERAEQWNGVELENRSDQYAMIALQGPKALFLLKGIWDSGEPENLDRFSACEAEVAGADCLVCRTGYTGEDGVELLMASDQAEIVWTALVEAGAQPIGLGARDTLRLEVCYPLYGNDLSLDRTPIEAGLNWCCALDKDFVGVERMREQVRDGLEEKLVAFALTGAGIPRAGCKVLKDGDPVGEVTSGTFSPSLEKGIGMGYVKAEIAELGTEIEIDVRGKVRPARIEVKPLYRSG